MPDYSRRTYGKGGLMPRSVSHQRGTGSASPMYVYRWEPSGSCWRTFARAKAVPMMG